MRDHRRLKVFDLAHSLAISVYSATKHFPDEERYGLTSQIRRSAVSVPSNIVEGCARGDGDYARFLKIAYASCRELEYQLELATALGFLDKESDVQARAGDLSRALKALVQSQQA